MEIRSNVKKLIAYLDENQPTTIARVVHAGVMNACDAANALQYAIRHGLIERTGPLMLVLAALHNTGRPANR
jgi:hypothetical protein